MDDFPCPIPLPEFFRLLAEAREGSRSALGQLLSVGRPHLLHCAGRLIGRQLQGKASGSDLVQMAFLGAVRDFDSFDGYMPRSWFGWLDGILANCVLNLRRDLLDRQKRQVTREVGLDGRAAQGMAAAGPSPSRAAELAEEEARLHLALRQLPTADYFILALRFDQGLTFNRIGSICGCSADAVRKRCQRARDHLAAALGIPQPVCSASQPGRNYRGLPQPQAATRAATGPPVQAHAAAE